MEDLWGNGWVVTLLLFKSAPDFLTKTRSTHEWSTRIHINTAVMCQGSCNNKKFVTETIHVEMFLRDNIH